MCAWFGSVAPAGITLLPALIIPLLFSATFPLLEDIVVGLIVHPPMAPASAVTVPVIVALVAVSTPPGVTLNSAVAGVLSPA